MNRLKDILAKYGVAILAIFHLVGLIGLFFIDQFIFASLTPLIMLISAGVVIAAEKGRRKGLFIVLIFAFLFGYIIELIGTKTGFPFGKYQYGTSLWPRIFGVPLIIGVNWFLITMGAGYFIRYIFKHSWTRILFATVLMVMLDVFIEPLAEPLGFWRWEGGVIPILNFIGWFGVSLVMQIVFYVFLNKHENKVAPAYFIMVAIFFMCLNIVI